MSMLPTTKCFYTCGKLFSSSNQTATLSPWNIFLAARGVLKKNLIIYYFPLLMVVLIICSDSFLGASFNFSFSASFSAFFFSYSSCLQFSSCARTNIFTKLSRVDTTIDGGGGNHKGCYGEFSEIMLFSTL